MLANLIYFQVSHLSLVVGTGGSKNSGETVMIIMIMMIKVIIANTYRALTVDQILF